MPRVLIATMQDTCLSFWGFAVDSRWLPCVTDVSLRPCGCALVFCPLQGSAADIVKGVMVSLQEQLASTGLAQHCHMLLQVRPNPDLPGCSH
jgi:hypothetical protein